MLYLVSSLYAKLTHFIPLLYYIFIDFLNLWEEFIVIEIPFSLCNILFMHFGCLQFVVIPSLDLLHEYAFNI